jgi:23S rRNA (adenine2503-C2)-methyltransferase
VLKIEMSPTRRLQILFDLGDGLIIETILIPCEGRDTTLFLSIQVGCAINCWFFYTKRMGLKRNLIVVKKVQHIVYAHHHFTNEVDPLKNFIFMGMGEPLDNFNNILRDTKIMVDCQVFIK